jgi:YVTN family beta-propeller protein
VANLPSGTVAFLFTDVEGSTELLRRLGHRYAGALRDHGRILEETFTAHGGRVVDTQGDAFFAVFARARDAAAAAADAQTALARHEWPDGAQLQVRMGIHVAEPELDEGRYVGLGVHRGARICSSAYGGQVLVSHAVAALLGDGSARLRDLGTHSLKDFAEPERLFQLTVDGLPSQFPPPRTTPTGRVTRRRALMIGAVALAAIFAGGAALALTRGGSGLTGIGPTSVGVIDAETGKLVDEIDIGFTSPLIAAGEGYVWVVDPRASILVKIDPRTREIARRTAIESGAVPTAIAAGGGAVWIALLRPDGRAVLELGPLLGEPRRRFEDVGAGPRTAVVFGGDLWLIDPATSEISRIDPASGRVRTIGEVGLALSLGVSGDAVWVGGANTVERIDRSIGTSLATIPVGSLPLGITETSSLAVGEGAVWFAASAGSVVWRIDPRTNTPTSSIGVGRGPSGVAVGEGAVWVANSGDGTVTRIDRSSNETRTITLGSSPGGVVVDETGLVWTSPGEPVG